MKTIWVGHYICYIIGGIKISNINNVYWNWVHSGFGATLSPAFLPAVVERVTDLELKQGVYTLIQF